MATVVITIMDLGEGKVIVKGDSSPSLPDDPADCTLAQKMSTLLVRHLLEILETGEKGGAIPLPAGTPPIDPNTN